MEWSYGTISRTNERREDTAWNRVTELSVELTGRREGTACNGVTGLSVELTGRREGTVWNGVTEL